MDIEYEFTPPKKMPRNDLQYSTPNKKTIPKDTETPKKSRVTFESFDAEEREQILSTPPKRAENPESKKLTKNSSNSPETPYKSPAQELMEQNQVSPFYIPRLEMDYQFIKYLGQGNFSRVGLYKSRLTEEEFAIKTTELSLMSVNEVQALGTLSMFSQKSKNIVRYYHSWVEEEKLYIVMEYCESSLKELFIRTKNQKKRIEEGRMKELLRQSLMGLKCMHQHNMVHLDIKPDNILLKDGGVKIADLGLCRITRIKRWSDLDEGDSRYLAKEVLNYHQGIDLTKADVYSLGMTFFQGAILEDLPNNGEEWLNLRDNGINMRQIPQLKHYSDDFQEILASMVRPNWEERPSCEKLLHHKYFKNESLGTNKRLSRFMRDLGKSSRKQDGSL